MKNTKANDIKILKAMIENKKALERIYEERGQEDIAKQCRTEWTSIWWIAEIMENDEVFASTYETYCGGAE